MNELFEQNISPEKIVQFKPEGSYQLEDLNTPLAKEVIGTNKDCNGTLSDLGQINKISDFLNSIEEIKYENWNSLELSEKETVLNSLEEKIAEIEHRPASPIHLSPLKEGLWGGYDPETKDITINSHYAEQSDYGTYIEVIDTLIHEGRHAYQDYNVNVSEIHPRHSEVASWAETMEGGKWGYWGDCSSLMGQRLYEQQSIEIDARNFAADVMDKLNLNA